MGRKDKAVYIQTYEKPENKALAMHPAGAIGDLLAQTSLFETDLSVLDL